jgi:hypothetical protein
MRTERARQGVGGNGDSDAESNSGLRPCSPKAKRRREEQEEKEGALLKGSGGAGSTENRAERLSPYFHGNPLPGNYGRPNMEWGNQKYNTSSSKGGADLKPWFSVFPEDTPSGDEKACAAVTDKSQLASALVHGDVTSVYVKLRVPPPVGAQLPGDSRRWGPSYHHERLLYDGHNDFLRRRAGGADLEYKNLSRRKYEMVEVLCVPALRCKKGGFEKADQRL